MMIKCFAAVIGCFGLISTGVTAQELHFQNKSIYACIENPAVFEVNQEEGRTYFIPERHVSLNGEWQFLYGDTPEAIPVDFYTENYNARKWEQIPVPSNWEMLGYGDKLFRNVNAPFKADPPRVPREYNPTGAYRKTFTLPSDWNACPVFLRFEKVASASFVWVNGQEVGYNEGGQEPAEYNITKYLRGGRNTIAVLVTKYSDGYYLEGQDYWRLAGIFDDVWLYAAPPVRLFDWQVITDLDGSYTDADLKITAAVKNYGEQAAASYRVTARLTDAGGQPVADFGSEAFTLSTDKKEVELQKRLTNPKKWTAETPNLYALTLQLLNAEGQVCDEVETRIGFKETEIRDGVFYLNGVAVKVNAQNSHMQHPELGHVMDETTIRKDFELLKQFNFNAVRTSHYPPVNRYLELANEYGLYIIDEAGVEAHATEYVSDWPEFTEMYRERVRRMVLRDRNYPCILFWSAGNESGEGFNITEVVKEGKKYDPTRYWMYGGNAFAHPAEDIIGPRYPTPMELEMQVGISPDEKELRPSFMDEYLSVAGNGGGGLDDYWRVIYAHPRLMGGAIWDYVSTGITERIRALHDRSPYQTPAHLMGNARLIDGNGGKVLDLNGKDQWVEVYRSENVEVSGDRLTLACRIYPRELMSSCGSIITKGSYQFGLQQRGKDSLEFYIYTDRPYRIKAPLPANWERNWHEVTAVYDGENMQIRIDGNVLAQGRASGRIRNFPFPVNIGRNAEIHGQETNVYICDAQLDNVIISAENVVLHLDFEEETDKGTFYSYGIGARTYGSIWPNRVPQPEMWQMKKTVQPVAATLLDGEGGYVEMWNRNHFTDMSQYRIHWTLTEDGLILQEGEIAPDIAPLTKKIVQIPYTKPDIQAGAEYRLLISASLKADEVWAHEGHEVAWEQFALPWFEPLPLEATDTRGGKAALQQTDKEITVSGDGFSYTFDSKTGLLYSIRYDGREMLKSPLQLNLWRAPLANEQDEWSSHTLRSPQWKTGYGQHIVTEFYSHGVDTLTHIPLSIKACEAGGKVYIDVRDIYRLGSSTVEKKDLYTWGMQSNGFEGLYTYIIDGDGGLTLRHKVLPQGRMPAWLPRIGLTMTVDKTFDQVAWYGRGPQENYPDRKTGYKVDIYQSTVADMYEPYLIPQDYGLRTDNRWVEMTNAEGSGIRFAMNEQFNFNAYPFSTRNLTKSMYTYQLQEQDGITLNLDYATSGTGCTARSIFDAYRALPQAYEREIRICPAK